MTNVTPIRTAPTVIENPTHVLKMVEDSWDGRFIPVVHFAKMPTKMQLLDILMDNFDSITADELRSLMLCNVDVQLDSTGEIYMLVPIQ